MKSIEAKLKLDEEKNYNTTGHTDGQACNVNE
jgi:hypothetical protein